MLLIQHSNLKWSIVLMLPEGYKKIISNELSRDIALFKFVKAGYELNQIINLEGV